MNLCECGCGTEVVNRYVKGHNPSPRKSYESASTARERLHSRVEVDDNGCFIWQGTRRAGYGVICVDGRRIYAHRLSYALHVGNLDNDDVVHHVCEQKLCVNPLHLEKMTHSEHMAMHQAKRFRAPALGRALVDRLPQAIL